MEAQEIIERLCLLSEKVYYKIDPDAEHSNDCFCGKGGFWGTGSYGGTHAEGFRNDGHVLMFIEDAVKKKLETLKG